MTVLPPVGLRHRRPPRRAPGDWVEGCRWRGLVLWLGTAATATCGGEGTDPDAPAVTVRDSAGLRIVESRAAAWGDGEGWYVDPEALFSVGETDGDPRYILAGVEGALLREGGGIVVANRQTNEVRFYDDRGRFERAVGGEGEGPGEFVYIRALRRCAGDTLFAFDLHNDPTLLTPEGELLEERTVRLPDRGTPYELACGGGRYVTIGWGTRVEPGFLGVYRAESLAWILDLDSEVVATLDTVLASERIAMRGGNGPHPFGVSTRVAAGPDRIVMGEGGLLEVRVLDASGAPTAVFRGPEVDRSLTDEGAAAYRDFRLDQVDPEIRPRVSRLLETELDRDTVPAYDHLEMDPEGNIWARRFRVPGTDAPRRWAVWAPDGTFLGHVTLPDGLELTEIGTERVVGVVRDALDVERVRVHRLIKPHTERRP